MTDILDPQARIETLLDAAEPRLARVFREAIQQLRDRIDLNELADLLQSGDYGRALDELQEAADALGNATTAVFVRAGESTATFLKGVDVARISFNIVNARAVATAAANRLRLVREFTEGQRDAVRQALTDGIRAGNNPRQQAKAFRDVVGLTERQSAAVGNYRSLLQRAGDPSLGRGEQGEALDRALRDARHDRSVERAIRDGTPIPEDTIDTMVSRYAERYVKYRAEVIGRTEALRSVNQGTEEGYAQAIENGLDSTRLVREWVSAHDNRVRDSHRHLDGMERGYGQTFPGLYGDLMYPGDPDAPAAETVQCRCVLTTRIRPARD